MPLTPAPCDGREADLQIRVGREDCPSPHSLANKVGRVLWGIVWCTLFRLSPRIFFGWRRWLLRRFGAQVGRNARISPSVRIWAPWNLSVGEEASMAHHVDCYSVGPVVIGAHATVSQYSFLCTGTHDPSDPHMALVVRPVTVGEGAWVCAGAWVMPGATIGRGAIVGARALVTRDVDEWSIVGGTPARPIGRRELCSRSAAG